MRKSGIPELRQARSQEIFCRNLLKNYFKRGIITKVQGLAQLGRHACFGRTPLKKKKPKTSTCANFRQLIKIKKAVKCAFANIFDRRKQLNNRRGVAQPVGRGIWDAEAASSSLATPTKNPLKRLISEDFFTFGGFLSAAEKRKAIAKSPQITEDPPKKAGLRQIH